MGLKESLKQGSVIFLISSITIFLFIAGLMIFLPLNFKAFISEATYEHQPKTNMTYQIANLCDLGNITQAKIKCVHQFMTSFFEYIPRDDRTIKTTEEILESGGVCRDFAVSTCSILELMEIGCGIKSIRTENISHVYAQVYWTEKGIFDSCTIDQGYSNCY